jgi:hypothetical protein
VLFQISVSGSDFLVKSTEISVSRVFSALADGGVSNNARIVVKRRGYFIGSGLISYSEAIKAHEKKNR